MAVYSVFGARTPVGVKVAVLVAEVYVTVPATLVLPGPVTVNVVAGEMSVAGFIALLKVALIAPTLFGQEKGVLIGVTESTVGEDNGVPGAAALSLSPQLVIKTANRTTRNKFFLAIRLCI